MSFTIDAGTLYQTVAASTTQACGPLGGHAGDYLGSVQIVPGTTSPGAVTITDGAGAAITIFAGGASSVVSLVPFPAAWSGAKSRTGAWSITTGANVTAIGFGAFT